MISLTTLILIIIFSLSIINYNRLVSNNYKNIKIINKILVLLLITASVVYTMLTLNLCFEGCFPVPNYNSTTSISCYIPNGESSPLPQDPVRWWPSGVPQSIAVVGTMFGAFTALGKVAGCSPRLRVLATLGAGGVTSSHIMYHSAMENSIGFNRFMFSFHEYRATGKWPSFDEMVTRSEPSKVQSFLDSAAKEADQNIVNNVVTEVETILNSKSGGGTNNFISSGSDDMIFKLLDSFIGSVISFFKPAPVSGYLDDLLGQQIVIEFILLFTTISLLLLLVAYIVNNLLLFNKDYLIKRFGQTNKFIKFYLKYEFISIKFPLFISPIFMFMGFYILIHGLHFLITHQIPFETLGIDLHTLIKPK